MFGKKVFGRKGGGGDERVEAQRQKLTELANSLSAAERAAGNLPQLRQQFADVWFDSPERDKALQRLGQARELLDLSAKILGAGGYREDVNQNIALLEQFVPAIVTDVDAFTATLIGRQHLWNARQEAGGAFNPTVRESQMALHSSASELAGAVQKHIEELRPIRATHRGAWPERLDLDNLQRHVDDGRQALGIYSERFRSHDEALPPQSSVTLLMIAQDMERALDLIEYERPNLAMDTLMRGVFKNLEGR